MHFNNLKPFDAAALKRSVRQSVKRTCRSCGDQFTPLNKNHVYCKWCWQSEDFGYYGTDQHSSELTGVLGVVAITLVVIVIALAVFFA